MEVTTARIGNVTSVHYVIEFVIDFNFLFEKIPHKMTTGSRSVKILRDNSSSK